MTGQVLTLVMCWSRRPTPDSLLSSRERACCAALPDWRRHQFARGRATARAALRMAGCQTEGTDLLRGADGAPVPRRNDGTRPPWSLSLSHCGRYTAAAVSPDNAAVGVDIERPDPRNARAALHLTTSDDDTAVGLPATLRICCKEAAFKADRGARGRLPQYSLSDPLRKRTSAGAPIAVSGRGSYLWPSECGPLYLVTASESRPLVISADEPITDMAGMLPR